MKVFICPDCGLMFGKLRLVDGRVPRHILTEPLHGDCPGAGKVPNVFGPNGHPVPAKAEKGTVTT